MSLIEIRILMRKIFMGVIISMIVGTFIQLPVIVYIMMGLFAAFIFIFVFKWRCPNCKKHLGKMTVHSCKHCGHTID